ncbi:Pectate lyase [Rheinheimera sp. A13L]|uniref:pectate lyase n=1 Tax=Rheinheimera sp. A13L TaxID=506534 RepID=UPI0002124902|nr:pectate lyase [Rheinheimera sp. A13L]EGM76602.1 Pectate lyase [Rheinheimera sp. A13L]
MNLLHRSIKVLSCALLLPLSLSVAGQTELNTTLMLTKKADKTYLSWSTEVPAVARQEIYRSTSSLFEQAERIAVLDPYQQVAEDNNFAPHQDYWYWLKVIDADGKEHLSNLSATVPQFSYQPFATIANASRCKAGATFSNETVDCGGVTVGSSCAGDAEGQKPVITLKNASVKNLRISASGGADGIHCSSGNCTIENVVWEDICEDAATNNGKTMTIKGGLAFNSANGSGGKPDKVFQHNSKNSTTVLTGNFTLTGEHGKLWRSCGDCTNNGGPRYLTISGVTVNGKIDSIAGVNSNYKDVATIRNLKIKDYKAGKPPICEHYTGVKKGQGKSVKDKEYWNSASCNVSKTDVTKL